MENEKNNDFTTKKDESPEGLNNLFGLSDSNGFKSTDMKSSGDTKFSGGRKFTQKEVAKQKKVFDKMGNEGFTANSENKKSDFDIDVPEKVTPKSESQWAERAAEIAEEKRQGLKDYNSLYGPAKSAADYQIGSSTKTDIANERSEEKKKLSEYAKAMDQFKSPFSTFKDNLEELTAEDRKQYEDALSVANDMTIDESRRKQAQNVVDELKAKGSKLVSDTMTKEYNEKKQRDLDIKNAEATLANPDGKTPDEINKAKSVIRDRDNKERFDKLVSEGKTGEEASKIVQEENEYNDISSEYVNNLKALQSDPYAGEYAREQLEAFNLQNQLAEKHPDLISKKTASEILKAEIAQRAKVTQLQKAGKEREARMEQQRLAEKAKRRRQSMLFAAKIGTSFAARLLPLLYLPYVIKGGR